MQKKKNMTEPIDIQELPICRLCAQITTDVVDIYSDDGASHNLPQIINKHLPISVQQDDTLPLSSCISCTNTLLAFDQLVISCIEANKHFEELEVKEVAVKIDDKEYNIQEDVINEDIEETDRFESLTDSQVQNLKAFCQDASSIKYEHIEIETVDVNVKTESSNEEIRIKLAPSATPRKIKKVLSQEMKESRKKERESINNVKEIVDGKIYYKCKICGKCLLSPYTYRFHMKIHTGERPFVCDLCGKQFRVSQGLARHIRETHAGIKKYPCDICERMFATRRNAEEHRRIHTNERPYICDLCGKTFKQKASLFVHNRSHNDVFPYRCSYCNHGFRTSATMMTHVTRHTGEKPHACDTCGRMFRLKNELTRHKLIHSDVKPFECTHCGVSFRMNRYLRNHLRQNHKEQSL